MSREQVLIAVADAARELREASMNYARVTADDDDPGFSIKWHEANQRELQAERALDDALDALAKVEGS